MRLSLLVTTAVASVLWFASGAAYGLFVWFSSLPVDPGIVLPETISAYTWQSVAPWNVVLPALGVLAFAAVFALVVQLLRHTGRGTFLPVWFASIAASFVTALLFAIGQTAANWPPMRAAMVLQYVSEALPDAGYWGIVWAGRPRWSPCCWPAASAPLRRSHRMRRLPRMPWQLGMPRLPQRVAPPPHRPSSPRCSCLWSASGSWHPCPPPTPRTAR